MPSASVTSDKPKRFPSRKIYKAIQINQNFWLNFDDLEYNISQLANAEKIIALEKFLSKYATQDLVFEQVGVKTYYGIPAIAVAFAEQYNLGTGFAGEHRTFTYPIIRKEKKSVALYFNNLSLINNGTQPGHLIPGRFGVWFNEDLEISKIKFAIRSTPIPYPIPFNWLAINFPLPPQSPKPHPQPHCPCNCHK